jgi:cytochrome c oxidase assembly protein subunit 15
MLKTYQGLITITFLLAIFVVGMGAYTRLSDAGLGCPDWPGCYGHMTVPTSDKKLAKVENNFPGHTVHHGKAWKEMIHRYVAGTLGLLILLISIYSVVMRLSKTIGQATRTPLILPIGLVLLVIMQSALGMLTVTMKLHPVVVMAHLIGGFSTLSLLFLLLLRVIAWRKTQSSGTLVEPGKMSSNHIMETESTGIASSGIGSTGLVWLYVALVFLLMQILLGGWLSANYAATFCPSLPFCHSGESIPFSLAAVFQIDANASNFEFGTLSPEARMSIHWLHRLGAIVTLLVVGLAVGYQLYSSDSARVKRRCVIVLLFLACQISLGLSLIIFKFPLSVALFHNLFAAGLLLSLISVIFQLHQQMKINNSPHLSVSP